jgi:poly-gamma-glutamate synthesis protein (capsule biosynthesis protein)
VVPVLGFDNGRLDRIELHPITLGFSAPLPRRGRPALARGEQAAAVLDDLRRLSAPFGTSISATGDAVNVELPGG